MLCPFCLADVKFKLEGGYFCPDCDEQVPAMYVRGYEEYPPRIVSAVGLRGHGKTVYFASLFYMLQESPLPAFWQPDFFALSLSDQDIETVHSNAKMLKDGKLPGSTPMNFPRPTMLRVAGIPLWQKQRNCTLVFYDTSGEAFERASELVKYARFARQAQMVMLLVSLPDIQDPPHEMLTLLNTYAIGIADLGGNARDQDLMVVYTKADEMAGRLSLPPWDNVKTYLADGSVGSLAHTRGYRRQMYEISNWLYDFTRSELKADQFVNLAQTNFRSVGFSIVSALGAAPKDGRLSTAVEPLRVLDPILWMMETAPPVPERGSWWTRGARQLLGEARPRDESRRPAADAPPIVERRAPEGKSSPTVEKAPASVRQKTPDAQRDRVKTAPQTNHARWVISAILAGAIYGLVGGILGGLMGGVRGAGVWALMLGGLFGLVGGFSGSQIAQNWEVLLDPRRWALAQGVVLPGSASIGGVMGGIVGLLAWLLVKGLLS
jgi:hypothetical protein